MDESLSMIEIERMSSIEDEPRTLNINQIQFAREAALHVVNTMSVEEALRIFTDGLEPVGNCVKDEEDNMIDHGVNKGLRDIVTAPF